MPNHHRKPNRLKNYNYNQPGYYFVTLTTKNRFSYFGKIIEEDTHLNEYGFLTQKYWQQIPVHYPNVDIDVFAILPNHIHGIIIIEEANNVGVDQWSTPTIGLLSKVIKSYKGSVTKAIYAQFGDGNFGWQRSYYDHIIRHEKALAEIRTYITNNSLKHFLKQKQ